MTQTKLGKEIRAREIDELKRGAIWIVCAALVFLWLAQVPGRIAVHFGIPADWAYPVVNNVTPFVLLLLFIAVDLAIRWIGQHHHSTGPRQG
jgi:hypothetical protein